MKAWMLTKDKRRWALLFLSLTSMPSTQSLSSPFPHTRNPVARQQVLRTVGSIAGLFVTDKHPTLAVEASTKPIDFTVVQETKLPFSQHYLENARRLVLNLQWAIVHSDAEVDRQVKQQIVTFSSLYRRDNYTLYGPMPGSQNLLTAYSAAAEHYARYGFGTPMPERLVNTIDRNLGLTRKAMAKSDLSMDSMMEERFK